MFYRILLITNMILIAFVIIIRVASLEY